MRMAVDSQGEMSVLFPLSSRVQTNQCPHSSSVWQVYFPVYLRTELRVPWNVSLWELGEGGGGGPGLALLPPTTLLFLPPEAAKAGSQETELQSSLPF